MAPCLALDLDEVCEPLPLVPLTLEDIDRLPRLPAWLTARRANEALLDAIPMILAHRWEEIKQQAAAGYAASVASNRWVRTLADEGDAASVVSRWYRQGLAGCDPSKINPIRAARAYVKAKISNKSLERDTMPGRASEQAHRWQHGADDSIEAEREDGTTIGDTLTDARPGVLDQVERLDALKGSLVWILPACSKRREGWQGARAAAGIVYDALGIKRPRICKDAFGPEAGISWIEENRPRPRSIAKDLAKAAGLLG